MSSELQKALGNLNFADVAAKSPAPADIGVMPGMAPSTKKASAMDRCKVRYQKIDVDDLGALSELERIETKALRNQGVWVISKERFLFMDKIFILISYIEEETQ